MEEIQEKELPQEAEETPEKEITAETDQREEKRRDQIDLLEGDEGAQGVPEEGVVHEGEQVELGQIAVGLGQIAAGGMLAEPGAETRGVIRLTTDITGEVTEVLMRTPLHPCLADPTFRLEVTKGPVLTHMTGMERSSTTIR